MCKPRCWGVWARCLWIFAFAHVLQTACARRPHGSSYENKASDESFVAFQQKDASRNRRSLASLLFASMAPQMSAPCCSKRSRLPSSRMVVEPFNNPIDWFNYGCLHLILGIPTIEWLVFSPPLGKARPLERQAAFCFGVFILIVGVAQALFWDSYGTSLGLWEFNDAKCNLRDLPIPLPIEEVLWLFHHILNAALYQFKVFDVLPVQSERAEPSMELKYAVATALFASATFGLWALAVSPDDSVKTIGLVAAFFAPVWGLIWNLGSTFIPRHADRFARGWIVPGLTTVSIDMLGQQQGVWRFPETFRSGIEFGYLKLDIFLVYMVSTFAVTATGAIILAAAEELLERRRYLGVEDPPNLLDLLKYIFSFKLAVGNETAAFSYLPVEDQVNSAQA